MNDSRFYGTICAVFFITALIFFAVYNQWILFIGPMNGNIVTSSSILMQKKQVVLHYFYGDKWKAEKQELLWTEKEDKNIFQLINALLTLLDEERVIEKKMTLQSVLISSAGCMYLSFDHNILGKQETIFKKWMLIEGILKTITANGIVAQQVQFLVQHKPLEDAHLDFSTPWPSYGFMGLK